MRCTKCGSEVEANDKFCMHCGKESPALPKQQTHGELKLRLLQALIVVILAAFMVFFAFFENAIMIKTAGAENLENKFSLLHAIGNLVSGTERYNPSVLSIVMGVTAFIFLFAASAFWLFSAAAILIRKGEKGLRRISAILTFLALGAVCAMPHLAYGFIPQFKLIYARAVGVLSEDIQGVSTLFLYIGTGLAFLLVVATWILAFKHRKTEGRVTKNEQ